jgi:uncharacterized membrane protein (UPF0127 family)
MEAVKYCVYNPNSESFLSMGIDAATNTLARLKGLIGKLTLGFDEGLWVVPSRGIHTFGVCFPLDLIYLDSQHRVVHTIESFPTFRVAPLRADATSVLALPTHSIYESQTKPGDQLVICVAEEMEQQLHSTANQAGHAEQRQSAAIRDRGAA